MSHGKDTLVKSMQTPPSNRLFNRRVGIPKPPKLPNRDHPMLPPGQRRQRLPSRQRFSIHEREKLCRNVCLPPAKGSSADYAGL